MIRQVTTMKMELYDAPQADCGQQALQPLCLRLKLSRQ